MKSPSDTFLRTTDINTQRFIGTERYAEVGVNWDSVNVEYSQAG